MPAHDITEAWKRYQLNKTEPEVLIELIKESQQRGEEIQEMQAGLRNQVPKIYDVFKRNNFVFRIDSSGLKIEDYGKRCVIGVDGSCQIVGGNAGIWFAPITAVRVIFENGLSRDPKIDAGAVVVRIDERKVRNVHAEMLRQMILFETKALNECSCKNKGAIVMLDGPVVDPPTVKSKKYVSVRCNAIKACIENGIQIIACVKRVRDAFLRKYMVGNLDFSNAEKVIFNRFHSDLYLVAYLFAYMRNVLGIGGVIYTREIDVSKATDVYESYSDEGVKISSFFIQTGFKSQILRIDIPYTSEELNLEELAKLIGAWTYPGQGIPLPVFVADEKCEVRMGCAQVLYEEIITKISTTDALNQYVAMFTM